MVLLPGCLCCGGSSGACLAGCPTKTNTLRLTISASDATWTCPVQWTYPTPGTGTMSHYFPFAAFNGSLDLTSSDGINYSYSAPTCTYYTPKVTAYINNLGLPSETCYVGFELYAPIVWQATGASCSTFDTVSRNYYSNTLPDILTCSASFAAWDGSKMMLPSGSVSTTLTPDDCVAAWSSPTRYYDATLSTLRNYFGTHSGFNVHSPTGTGSWSGSPNITVTGATFV